LLIVAVFLAVVAVGGIGLKVIAQADSSPVRGRPASPSGPASISPSTASAATDSSPPPLSTPADKPPTAVPTVRPTPRPAPLRPTATVTVLNNSTTPRLAARVAARVRALGFRVVDVGNLIGNTARTTIYYAAGDLAQADLLARDLPGRQRVLPRYAGLPSHAALTLVVTEDIPG
jgi:hypothetical protein